MKIERNYFQRNAIRFSLLLITHMNQIDRNQRKNKLKKPNDKIMKDKKQFKSHSFENQLDKEIQLVGFFLKPPTCFPIARLINSILSEHQTTRDENHESSHVSSWRMLRNAQHLYACWLTSFTFDSNYRWTAVPIILCICAFPHNLYSFEKASFYISFLSNKRIQKKNIESDIFLW